MGYSSDLTEEEWEIIEPLLLSQKKKTRPPVWTKRQLLNGIFYQLKTVVIGATYPEIYHHIQQSSGITKTGVRMVHSNGLRQNYMVKYANKSKKTAVDDLNHD